MNQAESTETSPTKETITTQSITTTTNNNKDNTFETHEGYTSVAPAETITSLPQVKTRESETPRPRSAHQTNADHNGHVHSPTDKHDDDKGEAIRDREQLSPKTSPSVLKSGDSRPRSSETSQSVIPPPPDSTRNDKHTLASTFLDLEQAQEHRYKVNDATAKTKVSPRSSPTSDVSSLSGHSTNIDIDGQPVCLAPFGETMLDLEVEVGLFSDLSRRQRRHGGFGDVTPRETEAAFEISEGHHEPERSTFDSVTACLAHIGVHRVVYAVKLRTIALTYQFRTVDWPVVIRDGLHSDVCHNYTIFNVVISAFGLFCIPLFIFSSNSSDGVGGIQHLHPEHKAKGLQALSILFFVHVATLCVSILLMLMRYYAKQKQSRSPLHQMVYDLKRLKKKRRNGLYSRSLGHTHDTLEHFSSRTVEDVLHSQGVTYGSIASPPSYTQNEVSPRRNSATLPL